MRRKIFVNMVSLQALTMLNMLIPFIIYPIVSGYIGVDKLSVLILFQTILQFGMIVTDFGFFYTEQKETDKFNYQNVQYCRLIITFSYLILTSIYLVIEHNNLTWMIIALAIALIGHVLMSSWFFLSNKKIYIPVVITFISRLFYVLVVYYLCVNNGSIIEVILLNSITLIIAGFISLFLVKRMFQISFCLNAISIKPMRRGGDVFAGEFIPNFYNIVPNIYLSGLMEPHKYALYMLTYKMMNAIGAVQGNITKAFYPFLNERKGNKRLHLYFIISISLLLAGTFYTLGEEIIGLFYKGHIESDLISSYITLFSIGIVLSALVSYFAYAVALANGHRKVFKKALISSSIFAILIILFTISDFSEYSVIFAILSARFLIVAFIHVGMKNEKK